MTLVSTLPVFMLKKTPQKFYLQHAWLFIFMGSPVTYIILPNIGHCILHVARELVGFEPPQSEAQPLPPNEMTLYTGGLWRAAILSPGHPPPPFYPHFEKSGYAPI